MQKDSNIVIATKCSPDKRVLTYIVEAGLTATELYLSQAIMKDLDKIISLCKDFPLRFAVHAPNDCYNPKELAELVGAINAEIVVLHNIFWEDEWEKIIASFQGIKTRLCIENTCSAHEPLKFIRRYNLGRCLDLEHLQMECCGVYEEEFINVLKQAEHVHLTGYTYGSDLWHTHIHYSKKHNIHLLNLLEDVGYSGFVVSEAKLSMQTPEEFRRLKEFIDGFNSGCPLS